ncbi:isochorismatase family protein [Paeniglutamicibacter psychrophenolicus]|uniref:isochorismatase family protein n=1 Tax=Paeniglutamicibacter psychrophenolicus TaxID=257454 RepID=UPI002789B4BE|nr:isochorismatase family protein [Paeniglutamicibacter psychrophenolicus]MDQ0096052.1 nicotinamidase-related amidase [Paeniglutamicibacter psychrophenolicus]
MSTFPDRDRTALVVIDVQNNVVADAYLREETIGNINELVKRARESGAPVVWVQHSDEEMEVGSADWEIVPELSPAAEEPVIQKIYGDSFEGTNLEAVLASAGVGRLFVSGAESDACIRSTVHGAFTRGYDVTLVSDAHTTSDMTEWGAPAPEVAISHINLYWQFQGAPGRTAAVVSTQDVDFRS